MVSLGYGYSIKCLHMLVPFLELTWGLGFNNYKDPTKHHNWPLLNLGTSCGQSIWEYSKRKGFSLGFDPRIWGGTIAGKNEFPWLVQLQITEIRSNRMKETFVCGGSVINHRYVLTAAHCCRQNPYIKTYHKIALSDDNVEAPKNLLKGVEKLTIHEKFDDQIQNDICLVRLEDPLEFSESIQPICLPVERVWETEDLTDALMTLVGWGVTHKNPSATSKTLQKAVVPVLPIAGCMQQYEGKRFENNVPITVNPQTQFCAGNIWKDACKGDSGGPVMYHSINNKEGVPRYFLIGLVSFGPSCEVNKQEEPGVFVKVSHYIRWILDNIYE